jgi:hypothetical protein
VQEDPTWEHEYAHFKSLIDDGAVTDLSTDRWLWRLIDRLSGDAMGEEAHA